MDTTQACNAVSIGRTRLFLVLSVALLVLLSWLGTLDRISTDYVDGALIQASVAFAVARALNAVVSTLQSIEVSAAIASFGPGQALDPINDMIEQFAGLMQMAVASLILQKILLVIISELYFKLAITLAGVGLVASSYLGRPRLAGVMLKTFVFMVFLRFSLVLVVMLNGAVDQLFLAEQTRQDIKLLNDLPASLDLLNQQDGDATPEQALRELREAADAEFNTREQTIARARERLEAEVDTLNTELAEARLTLEDITRDMSTMQRLNPLARSEGHNQALDRVELLEGRLAANNKEAGNLQRQSIALARERQAMVHADGDAGFWSSVGKGVAGMTGKLARLTDLDTYRQLAQTFENMVETIITVMVLFTLKTMLLPILFLLAFIKVCKGVWGIDMAALVSFPHRSLLPQAEQAGGSRR
ncbi:hypothetical protein [Halopseudomonas bauzanensis]|uniref:hypothetical protein n=1 Tax=Halopseudomonas bauzanensis TaxID=653930 RepID=UPI0025521319|nr:hypothetical protein [Halopseudomonas bauzanensis]